MFTEKQDVTAAISPEVNRLLSAAVVSKRFRELLLRNPQKALEEGYLGHAFALNEDDRAMILSIRADTLADFALQIVQWCETATITEEASPIYGIVTTKWGALQVHQKS
ncbi:MAG: hypothetical protein D6803_00670 [Anaerolineae bacterium]|nr:MAG: hypothetical protein D6803_00670 [Anaerolineae bacterium]